MGLVEFALLALSSIIAVMEPFSTIAVYAALTKDMDSERKKRTIAKSARISFLVLVFFALTGQLLFNVFNITIAAFQIAGGILLVSVALRMLNPEKNGSSPSNREDIAIVPLAFPLTSGPGTITAVILLVSKAQGILEFSFVFVGMIMGVLATYIGMRYSSKLFMLFGDEGLRVMTAIMSIIVLAIAVQFMIDGAAGAMTQIASTK